MISFIKRLHDGEIKEDFENYSFNEQEINNQDDYENFNKIFNNPQESPEDEGNHEDIYFQSDYARNQNEIMRIFISNLIMPEIKMKIIN